MKKNNAFALMLAVLATAPLAAGLVPKRVAYMRKSCVHGFLKNEAGLPLGPFRRGLQEEGAR